MNEAVNGRAPEPVNGGGRPTGSLGRPKIGITLTGPSLADVNALAAQHGVTQGEIVRRAIAVFKFINDRTDAGATFRIQTPDGESSRLEILYT